MESYNARTFASLGIPELFVQDNHSVSERDVIRGIHYQGPPAPASKLVRCTVGAVWDVAVDLTVGSATLGQWHGLELDASSGRQIFIPAGFGHAFVALTEGAEVQYKSSKFYEPAAEGTIRWDDPDLAIEWPVAEPVLSDKDRSGSSFQTYLETPVFRR